MAILISILIQMRGKDADFEASSNRMISRSEADAYAAEVELLERERKQLLAAIELLEQKNSSDQQAEAVRKQQELTEVRRRLDVIISRHAEMSQRLNNLRVENQRLANETTVLSEQLTHARAAFQEKAKAVEDSLDTREQKMDLPRVRNTSKDNVLMLMRFGKIYGVNDPDSGGFNLDHVSVGRSGASVSPKVDAGWNIEVAVDQSDLETFLSEFQSSTHFLTIGVWPDSFEAFSNLKTFLLKNGYDYQLVPLDNVDSVPIGSANSAPLVQ